jgi:hypothetical protein
LLIIPVNKAVYAQEKDSLEKRRAEEEEEETQGAAYPKKSIFKAQYLVTCVQKIRKIDEMKLFR